MLVRNDMQHDARVAKEARTLAVAGHQVTVLAEAGGGLPLREEADGYVVLRVRRPDTKIIGLRYLAHRRGVLRELLATAPDVFHAHDADALEPVGVAAQRLGVPYVYDSHELFLKQKRRGRGRAYWAGFLALYAWVERRYVRDAAGRITVSRPIADYLGRRYGRHFELVPNYPEVDASPTRREIRSLPGAERIPAEAPIVLRLGGLTPGRGVEQLVDAMALVEGAHLVLLGQGSIAHDLRRRADDRGVGDRVHVMAPVPEAQVVDYATSAQVGVSPAIPSSLNDAYSLPNKLFQYMAAGIPIVASDFPHLREIVLQPRAGLLADMRDPRAIAAAIGSVLRDPAATSEMGANGRRAALTRFNWQRSAETLLALYQRIERGEAYGEAG